MAMVVSKSLVELGRRYTKSDLGILSDAEKRRFLSGDDPDPQRDMALAWELLYRLEPELYERLARAERIHPSILDWLPARIDRIVEVGAGTGRLTVELVRRCEELIAVEPAESMREILITKLPETGGACRVEVVDGFFDRLPVPDDWASLVVTCSALTRTFGHGGDLGLAEMERICRPSGEVVIVWPNQLDWLQARGYQYQSFEGSMSMQFGSNAEAVEIMAIFYPHAAEEVRRHGQAFVPFSLLGFNPPRDLVHKVIAA
jgi:ubiquinone/menaquinone biosynthesis C-methylase UbiE